MAIGAEDAAVPKATKAKPGFICDASVVDMMSLLQPIRCFIN